jgi:hypothetical protein
VHHRLFIACLVVTKVRVLLESLANPGYVAMPKDAEAARKELMFYAIALNIL